MKRNFYAMKLAPIHHVNHSQVVIVYSGDCVGVVATVCFLHTPWARVQTPVVAESFSEATRSLLECYVGDTSSSTASVAWDVIP